MSWHCYLFAAMLTGAVGLGVIGLESTGPQPAGPQKVRIGTYDARAVAVAYAASEINKKELDEKIKGLKEAEAKGDDKRVQELKAWGESHQWLLHMQGFAGAPVENILAKVKDQLAAIAKAAGVAVIARKADFAGDQVEVVDVTDHLVKLFNPSERTLKTIADLRGRPTMDMAELEQELKQHKH
jgi:hypothetical protein